MVGEEGDLQDGDAVSQAVIEGVAGLINGTQDDDLLDSGYDVLGNVQVTFPSPSSLSFSCLHFCTYFLNYCRSHYCVC